MTPPHILIIEDEPIIAEDIADLCRMKGYTVAEIAYTAGQALSAIQDAKPTLILMDINLHDEIDGTDIAEYLNKHHNIPFIYITSYADAQTLAKVAKTGPHGYIVKPFNKEQIYSTIELVWSKASKIISPDFNLEKINKAIYPGIKEREAEVLDCLYRGMDTKQIAESLFISSNTVKFHIKKLHEKFNVHSRVELIHKVRTILYEH